MTDHGNETYLGDGLYASFDGYTITLRAPRVPVDHWVALEPDVLRALIQYARDNKVISSATA
jgi:hypothetical protein